MRAMRATFGRRSIGQAERVAGVAEEFAQTSPPLRWKLVLSLRSPSYQGSGQGVRAWSS